MHFVESARKEGTSRTVVALQMHSVGVVAEVDDLQVTLCREGGGDRQCISVPKNQNTTITQTQGPVEIKNRVNAGGSTIINATQN